MKQIPLTRNRFALVDDEDFERLNQWKWTYSANKQYQTEDRGYAYRMAYLGVTNGKQVRKHISMHKLINNTPQGMHTDHINGDNLDNRKSNLRTLTHTENLNAHRRPNRRWGSLVPHKLGKVVE